MCHDDYQNHHGVVYDAYQSLYQNHPLVYDNDAMTMTRVIDSDHLLSPIILLSVIYSQWKQRINA
jgi:hypothetical protein